MSKLGKVAIVIATTILTGGIGLIVMAIIKSKKNKEETIQQ